jgi:hypothetical protein
LTCPAHRAEWRWRIASIPDRLAAQHWRYSPSRGAACKKAPANREGLFSYFSLFRNSCIWIFCDEDLIRSSSLRNSAVSSAIDLGGGLGGKGITSDIGRTSLGYTSAQASPSVVQLAHFCGAGFFTRPERALINSEFVERSVLSPCEIARLTR